MKTRILIALVLMIPIISQGQDDRDFRYKVKYTGPDKISNIAYHDGQMRPAVGVHNYQVMRANRDFPEWSDNMGWTYNHAPMLAYWNGYFLCQYLSNPMGEHVAPGVTMLARSEDGVKWESPRVIFPIYFTATPGGKYPEVEYHYMHQRMGFYVAPDGRLLLMAHYGGNRGEAIGRVVREMYKDFSLGPIYFIRMNEQYSAEVKYPMYNTSEDEGFVQACEAFMSDPVRRIQWWEEDYLASDADSFYMPHDLEKAFCFYTISDSLVIGLFKSRMTTYTTDGGLNWAEPREEKSFTYSGAKIWGQKLDDDTYAVLYNPTNASERHPLCIATGEDGLNFDKLAVVHGEVPVKRYWGVEKRPGPQYVRGIVEGNGNPPGDDLWVVYSVSKEDIWISRIPVPANRIVKGPVHDDFDLAELGKYIPGWNIYAPQWCPVKLVKDPESDQNCMMMKDVDPYDYARATRVFGIAPRQKIDFELYVKSNSEPFEIDVCDSAGARLIQLSVDAEGNLNTLERTKNKVQIEDFSSGKWVAFSIDIDAEKQIYAIEIDGKSILEKAKFSARGIPERIDFRTGEYRLDRPIQEYKSGDQSLPGFDESEPDQPTGKTIVYLKGFSTTIME
jgi:hypothetical protein